jgi:hypothetical protein
MICLRQNPLIAVVKKRSDVGRLFFAATAYAAILFSERNDDKRYNFFGVRPNAPLFYSINLANRIVKSGMP